MRVFVTGATGFVGSATVQELLRAGHKVLGLARSDAGANALAAAGAEVLRGNLEDLDSLRRGAAQADGVIHTGFNHDFSKFKENCETDRRAIEAIGMELAGSDRPLIVTSGIGLVEPGRVATEDVPPASNSRIPRVSEQAAYAAAEKGARVSIVRLPPSVHGAGDHGFVPILIGMAREKGASVYTGEGLNRWPAVHRFDAARLYRLVLEKGRGGARYHAVAEAGLPFREIAAVIGRRLGVPVVSKSPEESAAHFGWFAHFAAIDNEASSALTRQELGWEPTQAGLIEDVDQAVYFQA
ncbi:MAG: SDR family oxidoreductase [Mesorhizobium sp.]|uniref:SDR family oxidoreductase n=1 Tax=Mesorhizobium sp. TaxID=1871066 RepID=UPI000FE68C5E|nr:SDR family oxidoreductase [Mesorhizobium sp.]RWM07081.1 MAG: SDR family oxidoreductase [Mesorhizobium sp.]TIO54096.1 MAG: SDR family oxidoreductase [Mesorhizobium sp.]TIO60491.1 MAG: SDR family oxidoreductase [Mesorhizobium sp.]TJV62799.1 MAG: SDR family oxidoreductase [Mesorhizobium sp.]